MTSYLERFVSCSLHGFQCLWGEIWIGDIAIQRMLLCLSLCNICVKRVRGRQGTQCGSTGAEVWCDYTVSKIAITFNYLAGCTNQNGRPEGPVANPLRLLFPHSLIWSNSLLPPPADFHIITDWTLLCYGDECHRPLETAQAKPNHISYWWLLWFSLSLV